MKPTVDIEIKGKTYTLEATFDILANAERITGVGIFETLSNPRALKLEEMKGILFPFVNVDITEDQLKDYIINEYDYVFIKIIQLLKIGFDNPNSKVIEMKNAQNPDESEKKK